MSIDKETLFYLIGILLTLGSYICSTTLCDLPLPHYILSSAIVFVYVVIYFGIQGYLGLRDIVLVMVVYVLLVVALEVVFGFLKGNYGVVIIWR